MISFFTQATYLKSLSCVIICLPFHFPGSLKISFNSNLLVLHHSVLLECAPVLGSFQHKNSWNRMYFFGNLSIVVSYLQAIMGMRRFKINSNFTIFLF